MKASVRKTERHVYKFSSIMDFHNMLYLKKVHNASLQWISAC